MESIFKILKQSIASTYEKETIPHIIVLDHGNHARSPLGSDDEEITVDGDKTLVMNLAELTDSMSDLQESLSIIKDKCWEWYSNDVISERGDQHTTIIKTQNSNIVFTDD